MLRSAAPSVGADPRRVRRRVAISAAITALGGLLFGYDTGVVSGALGLGRGKATTRSGSQGELGNRV